MKRVASVSNASVTSNNSVDSVGIGQKQVKDPAKKAGTDKATPTTEESGRVLPDGRYPQEQLVFDTIVYVFHCSAHDTIFVKNFGRNIHWLPFVALTENSCWEQATRDGIMMIIGKKTDEPDEKLVGGLPNFFAETLEVFRVQVTFSQFVTRLTKHIKILPTPYFDCCKNNPRGSWISISDLILNKFPAQYYGPDVRLFASMIHKKSPIGNIVQEYTIDSINDIFKVENSPEADLFTKSAVGDNFSLLYQDFFEHCFPAVHMTPETFKQYFIRYGFDKTDERWPWLFKAFQSNKESRDFSYITFVEFLIGVLCMEPNTENSELRSKFLFRYYDTDSDQILKDPEFTAFIAHLQLGIDPDKKKRTYDFYELLDCEDTKQVKLAAFVDAIPSKIPGTEGMLRSPKAVLPQTKALLLKRVEQQEFRNAKRIHSLVRNARRKDRGTCWGCKVHDYEYGLHCVDLDYRGRCVRPLRMRDYHFANDTSNVMSATRYSAEFVFGIGSICNMFIDLIRDLYRKEVITGIFAQSDQRQNMLRNMTTLAENVGELLSSEDRIVKVNAPVTVVGSIFGDWDAVFTMERVLWTAVPILGSTYVFLGNYIGKGTRFNVETLIYLLSLKMLSPNQVILLRGINETRELADEILLPECRHKYGNDIGMKVYDLLLFVCEQMPFGAIVDDTIFCVHSGIPLSSPKLSLLFDSIPVHLRKVQIDSPLAYELLSNIPENSYHSEGANVSRINDNITEFSQAVMHSFFKHNSLRIMMRGYHKLRDGYDLHYEGQCITVCSTLCEGTQKLIVAMIDPFEDSILFVNIEPDGLRNNALLQS